MLSESSKFQELNIRHNWFLLLGDVNLGSSLSGDSSNHEYSCTDWSSKHETSMATVDNPATMLPKNSTTQLIRTAEATQNA